jgi:DNA topoisomerase-1
VCGTGEVVERKGKFGPFFACDAYPKCKTVYEKDGDKYVPQKKRMAEEAGRNCPQCGKPLLVRKSEYGRFVGCSGFPACRFIEKDHKEAEARK